METAPWKRQVDVHTGTWMKYAYFKEVVATGGAEGKQLEQLANYEEGEEKPAPLLCSAAAGADLATRLETALGSSAAATAFLAVL